MSDGDYIKKYWQYVKNEQIKQVDEQTDSASNSNNKKIQNAQCIAVHPLQKNIIAIATQQTVEIYDLLPMKKIYGFDIPNMINQANQQQIVQQVMFIQSAFQTIKCHIQSFNEELIAQQYCQQYQLAILLKNQRFILIIDLITKQIRKICFQDTILSLCSQNNDIEYKVDMDKNEVKDKMFERCQSSASVPRQLFIAITTDGFYIVGMNDRNVQVVYKQLQFIQAEDVELESKITFTNIADRFILAKGRHLYYYKIDWISLQKEKESLRTELNQQILLHQDKAFSKEFIEQYFQSLSDISLNREDYNTQQVKTEKIFDLTNVLDSNIQSIQYVKKDKEKNILVILTQKYVYKFITDQLNLQYLTKISIQTDIQTLKLEYQLNEQQQMEYQQSYSNSHSQSNSSDFDIYEYSQQSSSQDLSIHISQDEETLTNQSICSIEEESTEVYGYDYFIKNSNLKYKEQAIPLIKILKDNQQMTEVFSQMYQYALKQQDQNVLDLSKNIQFFGQEPQILDDDLILLQINILDDPILYSFSDVKKDHQPEIVMNNNSQNLHFSKNILKLIKLDEQRQYLIASRGDKLFIYMKK